MIMKRGDVLKEALEKKKKIHILLPVYFIMILVIFILLYFSVAGYLIIKNTTSQLGAQNTPNAWVMNAVFMLLGIACVIEGWTNLKGYWFPKIILTIFGVSLLSTGIFRHAPINENIAFNMQEDQLHSLFASITGFSFTMLAFSATFIERSS